MARTTTIRPARRRRGVLGSLVRVALILLLLLLIVPPLWVAIYKVVPPPLTILMVERSAQGRGLDHRWRLWTASRRP